MRLTGAITENHGVSNAIIPLGKGYIFVPSQLSQRGYVRVKVYYSPHLTGGTKKYRVNFYCLTLHKYYCTGNNDIDTWEIQMQQCSNDSNRNILLNGIQNEFSKCYTQSLLSLGKICFDSPFVTVKTNINIVLEEDTEFSKDNYAAVARKIHTYQEYQLHLIKIKRTWITSMGKEHRMLLFAFDKLPHKDYIQAMTPTNKIKTLTKWQLWHARLGHQLDDAITTASKYIDGVPKFTHRDLVLEVCSTCIQAKQTKNTDTGTTLKPTVPFKGFSMALSFTDIRSKNLNYHPGYLGVHGETCWLVITEHISKYMFDITLKSKAVPL